MSQHPNNYSNFMGSYIPNSLRTIANELGRTHNFHRKARNEFNRRLRPLGTPRGGPPPKITRSNVIKAFNETLTRHYNEHGNPITPRGNHTQDNNGNKSTKRKTPCNGVTCTISGGSKRRRTHRTRR
jgi:hypothetical protein